MLTATDVGRLLTRRRAAGNRLECGGFRRLKGYADMPMLVAATNVRTAAVPPPPNTPMPGGSVGVCPVLTQRVDRQRGGYPQLSPRDEPQPAVV